MRAQSVRAAWQLLIPALMLLLLGLLGGAANVQAESQAETQRRLQALQEQIRTFRAQLSSATDEQRTLQQQLEHTEREASAVQKQLDTLRRERLALGDDVRQLTEQQAELQRTREKQAAALGEQLALAFRHGRQDKLKLLLNQEEPERVARLLQYHRYFTEARVAAIEQLNYTLDQLASVDDARSRKVAELSQREQALTSQQQQLKRLRDQRRQVLAKVTADIKQRNRQLAELETNRQRLQQVLEQLQQALAKADLAITTQQFGQRKGKLEWPVTGPVLETFGSRQNGIQSDGMLIGAGSGTEVMAVHHGRVVYSDWLRGYGLVLIIDHGDGYMSLYGHNQSLLKEVGDWVATGDRVARVGDTGGQERDGLYFAIRRNGKPQNPQRWLERRRG